MNTHASFGMHKIFDNTNMDARVYALVAKIGNAYTSMITLIELWSQRAKGRSSLAALSPRMLQDIGITAFQAQSEVEKPFWRA